ncbi:MAG: hypothetical protein WD052_07955, partial [Bacteroidales bacterium]
NCVHFSSKDGQKWVLCSDFGADWKKWRHCPPGAGILILIQVSIYQNDKVVNPNRIYPKKLNKNLNTDTGSTAH